MEWKFEYNPYTQETIVHKKQGNRWRCQKLNWVESLQGKSIEAWFRRTTANWEGLAERLRKEDNNDDEPCYIYFYGRKSDFDDLEDFCTEYSSTHPKKIIVCPPDRFDISDQLTLGKLDTLKDEIVKSGLDEPQIQKALHIYHECRDSEFEIAVVATMSSGKSTLINALLRQKLLPTGNEATTAKIMRIHDQDGQSKFTYQSATVDEQIITHPTDATLEKLKAANSSEQVFYIDLFGDLPGIQGKDLTLKLLDTPGPNNSVTEVHREVTDRVIHDKERQPVILFLLDATKLRDNSEAALLHSISHAMESSGERARERFIFVLNRADQVDPSNDEDIDGFVERSTKYLEENFHIRSPLILPISSKAALLASCPTLDRREQGELLFLQGCLEEPKCDLVKAAAYSPSVRKQVEAAREKAKQEKDDRMLTMVNSGIYGLELTINEYLEKYALPYKIHRCVQGMLRQLQDLKNNASFEERINSDEEALKKAIQIKDELIAKKEELTERGKAIQEKSVHIGNNEEARKIIDNIFSQLSQSVLSAIEEKVEGKESLPENEAKLIVDLINGEVDRQSIVLKETLPNLLEKQVYDDFLVLYSECEKIVDEFKEYMSPLSEFGLDPDQIANLGDLRETIEAQSAFSVKAYLNMESMPTNPEYRTVQRTGYKPNPERQGFWGFFKFWEPESLPYTYYETQKTGRQMVNTKNIMSRINKSTDSILSQQEAIIAGIEDLYTTKKNLFSQLLSQIGDAMEIISRQLEAQTDQANAKEADLKKLQELKVALDNWLATILSGVIYGGDKL